MTGRVEYDRAGYRGGTFCFIQYVWREGHLHCISDMIGAAGAGLGDGGQLLPTPILPPLSLATPVYS